MSLVSQELLKLRKIVAAAAESNLRRQTQTIGTAFCLSPLEDAFGPYTNNEVNYNNFIAGSFIPPDSSNPFPVSLLQALEQSTLLSNKGVIDFSMSG